MAKNQQSSQFVEILPHMGDYGNEKSSPWEDIVEDVACTNTAKQFVFFI